tara:strand:- start:332 stop:796 length:465 start_codon:yes stop_codon:yes gene_type:complete
MAKRAYTWGKVQAGDIISFRYKGKNQLGKLTTLLVLNPKLPFQRKDSSKTFHLVGLKLEERGTIPTIKEKPLLVELLEKIGQVQVVSGKDQIYRILIENVDSKGVGKNMYEEIKNTIERHSVYRTYDYAEARKSQVFLEPIVLPKSFREQLIED